MFGQNLYFLKTCITNSTNNNCQCFTCPSESNIMMSHVKRKTCNTTAATKMTHNTNSNNSTCSSDHQQKIQRISSSYSSYSHCNLFIIGLIFIIIACNDLVEGALRNVNLIIEPPAVRRGQHAVLRCMYDLEGAPLYSAKFYRGQLEFYRYTPGEFPNTKVFPFPGIHVDVTSSNATQVLIRNVGFGLSGNFSCEVTADAPLFSTATAFGAMQVVELPEKRPQLFTEHTRYEPGDILRANCSTPPSRPKAELKFTINNMVVNNVETQFIRTIDNLIASRISLKLQLQGIHFSSVNPSVYGHSVYGMNSVHGGGLVLRCTATIGELYQEYKEIELGTPQKDPVPARVTLSSGSTVRNFLSFLSSGKSKISTMDISKLLLLTGIVHANSIGSLIVQLLTAIQILLLRYKNTLDLKQHSQNVCAFLRLALLSQR
ncbi:hypothetical protein FF38_05017 [Lucilia cuprina]|uniref:Ig-like domain-containing protein n=1 Tax=Lucilia cuprina TaxID=7375 RepID=A0A0L0CJ42_LUCCU|nr:hypothetical protein CVS40_0699 [Lucilia cuprina]KAI8130207.1 hypothetical protein CVS40_0699 [Lucilia cuprina]KNC32398.1 hypothetical protein FF38_05017 [Lucilia cuprina]